MPSAQNNFYANVAYLDSFQQYIYWSRYLELDVVIWGKMLQVQQDIVTELSIESGLGSANLSLGNGNQQKPPWYGHLSKDQEQHVSSPSL